MAAVNPFFGRRGTATALNWKALVGSIAAAFLGHGKPDECAIGRGTGLVAMASVDPLLP